MVSLLSGRLNDFCFFKQTVISFSTEVYSCPINTTPACVVGITARGTNFIPPPLRQETQGQSALGSFPEGKPADTQQQSHEAIHWPQFSRTCFSEDDSPPFVRHLAKILHKKLSVISSSSARRSQSLQVAG